MGTVQTNKLTHFDFVGSFLRPEVLKQARVDFENKEISAEALREVENKEIRKLVAKQKELGFHLVTDGEFRRSWWHLDFMWGFDGVERTAIERGYQFHGAESRAETVSLSGKIRCGEHPFFAHFDFLKEVAEGQGVTPRQTIPAPAQLLIELERPENIAKTKGLYPSREDLIDDIAEAYHEAILGFYERGCRHLQLDDCTWGMLCDKNALKFLSLTEEQMRETAELHLKLNNLAIQNVPEDLHITTHVCRGNFKSTYASSGGYDSIADILFPNENVSSFYLEFDDERSGSFEPLRHVPENKNVVLGLITSKYGKLEDKEGIVKRIKEAANYVSLEHLCLSPQCGFASTEEGNILTEEEQWEKLRLIKEIAEEVWE